MHSHHFFSNEKDCETQFQNAFKHYVSLQDNGKRKGTGLSFIGTFTFSNDVCYWIVLNWDQNINNFSTQEAPTKPITSLKSTGGSKGQWFPLEKETYDRVDCKTGHCNSWIPWTLAPQLSREKKLCILHRRYIVSVLHSHTQYTWIITWKKGALQQPLTAASVGVYLLNWQ